MTDTKPANLASNFANLFRVIVCGDITRIEFQEGVGADWSITHTAITMMTQDAEDLAEVIKSTVARNKVAP